MRKIRQCSKCGKDTRNPKFCSRSCSASINNTLYQKRSKKYTPKYCQRCNEQISKRYTNQKFCKECNKNIVKWSTITLGDFKQKFANVYQMNARIRDLARQIYKKSDKPKYCINCRYNKFYEICHIKAIKNFSNDTYVTEINDISNLIALCPNCHWELDNKLLKVTDTGIEPVSHKGGDYETPEIPLLKSVI